MTDTAWSYTTGTSNRPLLRLTIGDNSRAARGSSSRPRSRRHYTVPRYVKFVDGFPMTVTGNNLPYLLARLYTGGLHQAVTSTGSAATASE